MKDKERLGNCHKPETKETDNSMQCGTLIWFLEQKVEKLVKSKLSLKFSKYKKKKKKIILYELSEEV